MGDSICRQIFDNIKDGVLDRDFTLSGEDPGAGDVLWAPGALDGIFMYHMGFTAFDEEQTEGMVMGLKAAAMRNFEETDRLFYEWTKKTRAVSAVDDLQFYAIDHEDTLSPPNIYDSALYLLLHSEHIECVKIGLELMGMYEIKDENVSEIIRKLGLYDEFTLFTVWNMLGWDDGNQEIFALAKKVRNWGRIHAVENLRPDTKEIREWLLTEGTVNGVMNSYSSLTCWKKSGAEEILFGTPSLTEYKGIVTLMDGLMDEGPVRGISALEDAEKVILRILEIAGSYDLDTSDYDVFLTILHWAEDRQEPLHSVSSACLDVLHSPRCLDTLKKDLKQGKGLRLAQELGIPFRTQLLDCMRKDFDAHYYQCGYLMSDFTYVEPTLRLFREKLPLKEMEGEPGEDPGFGGKYRIYDQLQFILQELDALPLKGIEFMTAGLRSPMIRNRNRALKNLQDWVQARGVPLETLCPELFETVRELQGKEVNDGTKKMIGALLEGQIQFEEKKQDNAG